MDLIDDSRCRHYSHQGSGRCRRLCFSSNFLNFNHAMLVSLFCFPLPHIFHSRRVRVRRAKFLEVRAEPPTAWCASLFSSSHGHFSDPALSVNKKELAQNLATGIMAVWQPTTLSRSLHQAMCSSPTKKQRDTIVPDIVTHGIVDPSVKEIHGHNFVAC